MLTCELSCYLCSCRICFFYFYFFVIVLKAQSANGKLIIYSDTEHGNFFYFLIKIQVAKSGYSRHLDSQFGRICVGEGKKKETISLHGCFGSLFSQPFSVHKVKLSPTCILFRDRKSFVCWWVQWKMHKSTFAIWMTLAICIHLFKERCLWRLSIFT